MKISMRLTLVLSLIFFISCGDDDDTTIETDNNAENITISLMDIEITIDENLSEGTIISTLEATIENSEETPIYTILNQTPEGAIAIDGNAIIVADPTLFDFETNTEITGQIEANIGDVSSIADFSITI